MVLTCFTLTPIINACYIEERLPIGKRTSEIAFPAGKSWLTKRDNLYLMIPFGWFFFSHR